MRSARVVLVVGLMISMLNAGRMMAAERAEPSTIKTLEEKLADVERRLAEMEKPGQSSSSSGYDWLKKIKFFGDFRYRYELIDEQGKSNRHRNRIRARLGFSAQINQQVDMVMRLATGTGDSVSANQTLDDSFSTKPLNLDLGYVQYSPEQISGLALIAGKIKNPFHMPGKSSLIWDGSLNPEGLALKYSRSFGAFNAFASAGAFWVEERTADTDSGLFGGQLGLEHKIKFLDASLVLGGGFFAYTHTEGYEVFVDSEAAFGNSAIASGTDFLYSEEYKFGEVFAEVKFKVLEKAVTLFGDFVTNTTLGDEDDGWLVGVIIGKKKNPGDWDLFYNYRKLERDALLAAFSDCSFGGGGTNAKGHVFGGGVRLMTNVDFGLTYFMNTQNIAPGEKENDYDRLQVDIKFKF
jgi:Putative porin